MTIDKYYSKFTMPELSLAILAALRNYYPFNFGRSGADDSLGAHFFTTRLLEHVEISPKKDGFSEHYLLSSNKLEAYIKEASTQVFKELLKFDLIARTNSEEVGSNDRKYPRYEITVKGKKYISSIKDYLLERRINNPKK